MADRPRRARVKDMGDRVGRRSPSEGAFEAKTLTFHTARFERAGASTDGSRLGLAIVSAIAERIESSFILSSPRPGASSGFEASIHLPIARADRSIRTVEAPR
jgi:hypothetical protein